MKNFILIIVLFLIAGNTIDSYAQNVAINNSGATPNASAILDVSSTTKGILIPRVLTSERMAIPSPAQGLLVYDINTRTFWYHDGSWHEIGGGGTPTGPASGDLSGSYPSPNVSKIQNLDISFGIPNDQQILKWNANANNWKGRNDSLFLPYNVAYSDAGKLFGIQNNNTSSGSSAVCGKSGSTGSGITPANSMGVWGDNSNGLGVVGTSNTGVGTFGFSFGNHGVYGYSTLTNFAGVCGSHANAGGIGVLGDISQGGFAIMGRSTGTTGKAALFTETNMNSIDTAIVVSTEGLGTLSYFSMTNPSNNKAAIDINQASNGNAIKIAQSKTNSPANSIEVVSYGNGNGIYSRSVNSTAAKFENTNANNAFPVMTMANNSLGTLLSISSTNTGVTGNVINVTNSGQGRALSVASAKGNAGYFNITDATATGAAVSILHPGLGRGEEIVLTKNTNAQAGLYVSTAGILGIHSFSSANDGVAIKGVTGTSITNGIGVLGQAGSSDPNGIGVEGIAGGGIVGGVGVLGIGNASNPNAIAVKGIGYTHNEDVGAVTGINMTDGVGVYGESIGFDGIGVAGTVGNTGNHSVAAVFTNNYTNNNRSVMELLSNGKGSSIFSDNSNLANSSIMIQVRNAGTGKFLSLETNLGAIVTTIAKNGNVVTDGTVTVNGDKGIVHNSSSTQLRTEILSATIPADNISHYDEFNAIIDVVVNFGTAFSSAPSVYFGNRISGNIHGITKEIINVTTTSCTIRLSNFTSIDFSWGTTVYKLIAIGAE